MRVAVVIPVHDAEPFLEQTLDSVLAQTYGDWTVVVVDDASSDKSAAIAEAYAAEHPGRFRVLTLAENVGVVRARNLAVEAAPGAELVALLDHDDWLHERYLERMVGLYDAERTGGRRIGIVACDARLYAANGFEADTWGQRTGWRDEIDLDALIDHNLIFARALFAREAFEEVGGFAPECAGTDDHDFWLRIVEAGYEVAVTREALAVYRLHTGGLSQDDLAMTESTLLVYRRMLARGALSAVRRRAVRRRIRHYDAVLAHWRARQAWTEGRRWRAAGLAAAGAPLALRAVLEDPGWWLARGRRRLPAPRMTGTSPAPR